MKKKFNKLMAIIISVCILICTPLTIYADVKYNTDEVTVYITVSDISDYTRPVHIVVPRRELTVKNFNMADYGDTEVNLPNVPLAFFAVQSDVGGVRCKLERITFDWISTDLSAISVTSDFTLINIANCSFSYESLVELFDNLPTNTTVRFLGINISNNPGTSQLTDRDKAIATDKGYSLIM